MAPARRVGCDIIGQLARFAAGPAGIGAEPQLDSIGHRRAQLDASAKPVRRHCILQQHARCARPAGADARGAALKVAPLPVTKGAPAPAPLPYQSQRGIGAVGAVGAEIGPARPPVVEAGEVGLHLDVAAERRDPTPTGAPFVIGRGLVSWPARRFGDRHKAVAAAHPSRPSQHASTHVEPEPRPRFQRIPAAAVDFAAGTRVGAAGHLDRPGQRPRSIAHAAATAHHSDAGEARRVISRPIDPAAERVRLRHAVEHQQRAAGGVAAKRAQGHSLAGRMSASRVGAAEQLDAGHVLQQLIQVVARRLLDLAGADARGRIDPFCIGLGECCTGDDDRRRRGGQGGGQTVLQDVVERGSDRQQRGRGDGKQRPGRPPRPGQLVGFVGFRHGT